MKNKSTYDISGMDIEEISTLFFDEKALIESPDPIYRFQVGSKRYYYRFDDNQNPVFFTSVTTMLAMTLTDQSGALLKWNVDNFDSYEQAKAYIQQRADYGTFMHIELAELVITKKSDPDRLRDRLKSFIEKEKLPASFINHERELKKDVYAFAKFMIDYNVVPLAVEVVLSHPDGYATAIDLVCEMDVQLKGHFGEVYKSGEKKGQKKETYKIVRRTAIIDFKSGRKGFYESNELQLFACRNIWNHNFPEKPVHYVYNWSPKAWKVTPSYHLKDQTECNSQHKLPYLVSLMQTQRGFSGESELTILHGKIDISKGIEKNIQTLTFEQMLNDDRPN